MHPQDSLEARYAQLCREASDINEHLPVLRHYASNSHEVVEFGVRNGASTAALLHACPRGLTSVDINECPVVEALAELAPHVDFRFVRADTRELMPIACDLLFIDTLHTYDQLFAELTRHAAHVRRWILLHDTATFGEHGEGGGKGLWPAVQEFLALSAGEWLLVERMTNQNGLTILGRADARGGQSGHGRCDRHTSLKHAHRVFAPLRASSSGGEM